MNPAAFLRRNKKSHKGDYGRILIVAGSRGMSGAAVLTAMAALRSGAGLVTLAVPESIYAVTAKAHPEVMTIPFAASSSGSIDFKAYKKIAELAAKQDVLALGPGLSRNPSTQKLIRKLLLNSSIPVVLDADGLNAFEGQAQQLLMAEAPLILTPHEGEFERLFKIQIGGRRSQARERKKSAREMAEKFGIYIVLKGNKTVAAAPDGKTFVNNTGNPGMATAGSGDVLTGVIAGLMGRRKNIFDTVCLGVHVHGLAGDFAAREKSRTSLTAGDILEFLPRAFKKLES